MTPDERTVANEADHYCRDHEQYMLSAAYVSSSYCRVCGRWRITDHGDHSGGRYQGEGLAAYRAKIDELIDRHGYPFLRDLGGHVGELREAAS